MWDYEDNSVFLRPEFTTIIFTSWKELLTMLERVSSRVGESIILGARK